MVAFSCSAEKSLHSDRVIWRAAPSSVSDRLLTPIYSAFPPNSYLCSHAASHTRKWIEVESNLFFFSFFSPFIFEARNSEWVFGLEEKIEKNGLGKSKELAAWVRKLPPASHLPTHRCHARDQRCWLEYLVAPQTDSFYQQSLGFFLIWIFITH